MNAPKDQSCHTKVAQGYPGLCRETLFGGKKNEDNNQLTVQRSDRSNKRRRPHRHQLGRKMCARECKPIVALGRLRPTGEEPFPPDPCTLPRGSVCTHLSPTATTAKGNRTDRTVCSEPSEDAAWRPAGTPDGVHGAHHSPDSGHLCGPFPAGSPIRAS